MPKQNEHDSVILPPSNFEAEEAVLGSILIDNNAIFEIGHFLKPLHFYRESNRLIFETFLHLSKTKEPLDIITVPAELSRRGHLEDVGREAYILSLVNVVPTSINIVHYARIVEKLAVRRQLIAAASIVANLAYDNDLEIEDIVGQAEKVIFDVAHQRMANQTKTMKEVASDHLEHIESLNEHGAVEGISTGFLDMDAMFSGGGMEKDQLIMIAGDTGMGKSALLLDIITNAAKKGHKTALFTLEMSERQMFQRKVASESRVLSSKLKDPRTLNEAEWKAYYAAAGRLSELPIHIDDSAFITPMQLLSKCRRLQATEGLDVIGVDYLALMGADGEHGNETLRLGSISRAFKLIAKELNCALVVCAQLNAKQIAQRADRRPKLADVRGSSDPNNDSDVVILIYRDEYYNPETSERPNIGEAIFAKQREGATGIIDLYWNGPFMCFRDLQRSEIDLHEIQDRITEESSASMVPGMMARNSQ